MALKFKTYEEQATLSVALAAVGGACAIAAALFILQKFDWNNLWILYSARGMRIIAIGGSLLLALLTGTVGFFVGLHSAGQRRNTLSKRSWTGFFLNATVILLTLVLGEFFFFMRYKVRLPGE